MFCREHLDIAVNQANRKSFPRANVDLIYSFYVFFVLGLIIMIVREIIKKKAGPVNKVAVELSWLHEYHRPVCSYCATIKSLTCRSGARVRCSGPPRRNHTRLEVCNGLHTLLEICTGLHTLPIEISSGLIQTLLYTFASHFKHFYRGLQSDFTPPSRSALALFHTSISGV